MYLNLPWFMVVVSLTLRISHKSINMNLYFILYFFVFKVLNRSDLRIICFFLSSLSLHFMIGFAPLVWVFHFYKPKKTFAFNFVFAMIMDFIWLIRRRRANGKIVRLFKFSIVLRGIHGYLEYVECDLFFFVAVPCWILRSIKVKKSKESQRNVKDFSRNEDKAAKISNFQLHVYTPAYAYVLPK